MSIIQLQNQHLKEFPELSPDITEIRINNNFLTEIPDSVAILPKLVRIIANNNNISKVSDRLAGLKQFYDLRLNSNKLQKIPEPIFNLKQLISLFLDNNELKSIPKSIGQLKQLKKLNLKDNQLETIPEEIGELVNLNFLLLNNNPIDYLPPPSIKNCKNLQILGLTGTKLPLPKNYKPQNVKETIDYVLENQKPPLPKLTIEKAFVFINRVVLLNYILLRILKFHNPAANKIVKSFTNGI